MGWIDGEAVRLFCPAFADVLERGQSLEGLETLAEVVGIDEGRKVGAKLVVVFVVVAPDGRLFERAVYPFDLTVGPGWFGLVSR